MNLDQLYQDLESNERARAQLEKDARVAFDLDDPNRWAPIIEQRRALWTVHQDLIYRILDAEDYKVNRRNVESVCYHGRTLYHVQNRNADGTPQRWRISSKVKTWKTRPADFRVSLKYGLGRHSSEHDHLTPATAHLLRTDETAAIAALED